MDAALEKPTRTLTIKASHSSRRIRLTALLLALFFLTQHAAAQTIGTCAPAEAEAYLDAGNVRARLFNNGSLFWSGGHPVYEVPKGSGHHVIFNTTIWLGGKVGGELRAAAGRYQQRQYWPGPLDDHGNPPADCRPFDRIYEINRDDLVAYAETGEQPPRLALDARRSGP